MGLFSATLSCDALFLASLLQSLANGVVRHSMTSIDSLLDAAPAVRTVLAECADSLASKGVSDVTPMPHLLSLAEEPKLAKRWRLEACTRYLQTFESGASDHAVISVRESGGPGGGSFLLQPDKVEHRLTDQAFVTSIRTRMYLPVFSVAGLCQHRPKQPANAPACGCSRDVHGLHALHCNIGGHVIARHNRLRDYLSSVIQDSTGNPAPVEQNSDATADNRRPDMVFQNWRGETQWVDVAIVSPFARIQGDPRHTRPGSAVSVMEGIKRRKYSTLALVPAVSSHLGRSGQALISLFRSLSRDADPICRSGAVSVMWQDWSCMLQKWNCNILASSGNLIPP
jgi:hypothetical protein